jgi:hypothetical protein
MLGFKNFITENTELLYERYLLTEEIASSDAKGKLHEILVGKHLSHPDEAQRILPQHYRNEETGKTPSQIHDSIKAGISPEDYDIADQRAKKAADQIRSHLAEHHGVKPEHIKGVYWTSNKSDHEKLTGKKDDASDADIMLHTVDDEGKPNYHGLSLKVGSNEPNLRNPGIDQLNKLTKTDSSKSKDIIDAHKEVLNNVGYSKKNTVDQNHAQYKIDKDSSDPAVKQKIATAETSKRKTLNNLASTYSQGINNLPHEHVKNIITQLVAPKTTYPHTRAWAQTSKDSADSSHHIEDHQEELQNELDSHQHGYTAEAKGQRVIIHANGPDGKPAKRIMELGMKANSGPVKGFNGTVKTSFNKKGSVPKAKPVAAKPKKESKPVAAKPAEQLQRKAVNPYHNQ